MITQLPVGTRVAVRGATTDLDPEFYGPPPAADTGHIVLSGAVTAGIEFDDGTQIFGISWAVVEPVDDG